MNKEQGWVVKHPKYGTWFIPRQSVIDDYKEYLAQWPTPIPNEISSGDIEGWFYEQIAWSEVNLYGKQIERPDMNAIEKEFIQEMKNSTRKPDVVKEVK